MSAALAEVIEQPSEQTAVESYEGIAARRRASLRAGFGLVLRLPEIFRRRAELRQIFNARADLGYDLLAERVSLTKLKGAAAEPYLQGLDILELRGERLLDVIACRAERGKRDPWRLSPRVRAERTQPNTAAGRRQTAWLLQLEEAGLLKDRE